MSIICSLASVSDLVAYAAAPHRGAGTRSARSRDEGGGMEVARATAQFQCGTGQIRTITHDNEKRSG